MNRILLFVALAVIFIGLAVMQLVTGHRAPAIGYGAIAVIYLSGVAFQLRRLRRERADP